MQAKRGPVRYSDTEIRALVAYAGAFGDGPAIPDVDPAAGDLAIGGELYRLNCAACHVASGSGAAIGGGRDAPTLMESTPTEIGQAIRVGPGAMPVFGSFSDEDLNSVARYVLDLQSMEATGVDDFGGAGPVAEGLAAWLLALLPLIALTRWIGTPARGPRRAARAGRRRRCRRRPRGGRVTIDDTSAPTSTARPVNQRAYRAAIISFLVAIAGGIVAAIGYGTDNTGDLLGLGLAAALVGIGFGLVCWAKYLDLDEHVVQQREPLQITPVARAEMHDEIEASTEIFGRRKVLLLLFGGSFASLVVGFVGPIGSLGPEAPRRAGPHVVEGRVAGW